MFHDDHDDHADTQLAYTSRHYRNHKRRRCAADEEEEEETEADGATSTASTDDKKKKNTGHPCLSDSDVASRCFARDNHIYFFSGVSKDSVYRLKVCICKLNEKYEEAKQKHPSMEIQPKPIYLHINSYGGGVFAAFAAIDFIQQSKIPVHTIIEGASASAATLMSVVGAKRYIRPHASMLIHQLSSWFGGKLTEIEDDYKNVTQMHSTIKDVYKKYTTIREAELEEMLKHDLWWNADKCLQEGLVDAIWDGE